jgi:hypothetical protein
MAEVDRLGLVARCGGRAMTAVAMLAIRRRTIHGVELMSGLTRLWAGITSVSQLMLRRTEPNRPNNLGRVAVCVRTAETRRDGTDVRPAAITNGDPNNPYR